jgi:hypothetical protein
MNADDFRSQVVRVDSASEQLRLTQEYFAGQAQAALLAA